MDTDSDNTSGCDDECPFPSGITWLCEKRFMFGVNYAWHNFGVDFGGKSAWSQNGVSNDANAVSGELGDMAANGANVIRWWVWPDFRGDGISFNGANATLLVSWYSNGYAGALGWSVTDENFNWSSTKGAIKTFADQHPCETRY